MALLKLNGYLIYRKDYQIYDEILTFICDNGQLYTCYALGVKKINSKNARGLNYGNKLEIEIFASNKLNKMSKLKTVTIIKEFDLKYSNNLALLLMNGIIYIQKYIDISTYILYKEYLVYILRNYNEYFLSCVIFFKLLKNFHSYLLNIKNKNILFYNELLKKNNLKLELYEYKFIDTILVQDMNLSKIYHLYSINIDFKKFLNKIFNHYKFFWIK